MMKTENSTFEDGVKYGIELVCEWIKEKTYLQDSRIVTKYYNWTIEDFINDLKKDIYGRIDKGIN